MSFAKPPSQTSKQSDHKLNNSPIGSFNRLTPQLPQRSGSDGFKGSQPNRSSRNSKQLRGDSFGQGGIANIDNNFLGVSDLIGDTDLSLTTTALDDTIHYLSPASPISPVSARTVNEGDQFPYRTPTFMRLLHEYGRVGEVTVTSITSSSISCIEPELQRTIAIIRPEAMEFKDVILRAIFKAGFSIIHARHIHLTPEQVSEIYAQHYGSPAFPYMVVSMSVGPILSLSLAAINAVSKWKDMVGPDRVLRSEWFFPLSMRVRFGLHDFIPNAVHASETHSEALKENRYFYPENILEPLMTEETKVWDYCGLYVNPTLLNGLAEVVRVKPVDPILHLAEWLLLNNPFQPRYPPDIAVLPT